MDLLTYQDITADSQKMCCIISGEPIEATNGRIKTFHGRNYFQTDMLNAPCADGCNTFLWFCGQFIPATCGITQCMLRKKVLLGDMSKYSCFQGQFAFCCLKAGACGEESCPDFCAFMEGCFCNFLAVSANRSYVMDKYDLASEPCDYRLIRINNCLQVLACICNILAIFIGELREIARLINMLADLFYHCVSGCMTAQVSHEMNYQIAQGNGDGSKTLRDVPVAVHAEAYGGDAHGQHDNKARNQY